MNRRGDVTRNSKETRLAAKVRRGEIAAPDDDAMADRYLIADDLLAAAGLHWYELSNWARPASSVFALRTVDPTWSSTG